MRIGIDFDNTIICYDSIFHKAALEQGLIHPELPKTKGSVKDYLKSKGQEDTWTEMQGYVYGTRILEAESFPGVFRFFHFCRAADISTCIISHKTRFPYKGKKYDLHTAAYEWLADQKWFSPNIPASKKIRVFFEPTRADKINRIKTLQCTHFIDDLPELLTDPHFPKDISAILFDPNQKHSSGHSFQRVSNWSELLVLIKDEHVAAGKTL